MGKLPKQYHHNCVSVCFTRKKSLLLLSESNFMEPNLCHCIWHNLIARADEIIRVFFPRVELARSVDLFQWRESGVW